MTLVEVAALLLDDSGVGDTSAMAVLLAAFQARHGQVKVILDAMADPEPGRGAAWLARHWADGPFRLAATDLALTALFGCVYIDAKVDADHDPQNDPAWAFVGRFWVHTASHPPGRSAGPSGSWAYPAGGPR